jgi:GNAT superfamily N-acetyltransferase
VTAAFEVVQARPAQTGPLAELFERCGSSCFCRYWHFPGDKNAWLARCAHDPEANREEFAALLGRGNDEARGLVAVTTDGLVIGWMKLAPAQTLTRLYASRPYRGVPKLGADRPDVVAVGCLLIDPEWRQRGVARALVNQAGRFAREFGARFVEAFPYCGERGAPELFWTGPEQLFREAGFAEVARIGQYAVLRLTLD